MVSHSLMTRQEVAKALKVHPNTVDAYRNSGRLPFVELGSATIRFRQADVDALVDGSTKYSGREISPASK